MTSAQVKPNRLTGWVPVIAWAAVIFVMSSRPGSTLPGGYSVQAHLVEYFILGALLFRALRPAHSTGRAVVLALIIGSLYGITDEIHQHFVVMRTPDVADWGLDTIGTFAGAVAAHLVAGWRARRA